MCMNNAVLVELDRLQLLGLERSSYLAWKGVATRTGELLHLPHASLLPNGSEVVGSIVSFLVDSLIDPSQMF